MNWYWEISLNLFIFIKFFLFLQSIQFAYLVKKMTEKYRDGE